jgi:protein-S-isoprenylcysteine O-methyltransferase Ste14
MIARNVILILLAMTGFAVVHSLTAGSGVKRYLLKTFDARLVEGWYRLAYNVFSVVSFAPVLLLAFILADRAIYTMAPPCLYLLLCIQVFGVLGFLWGVFSIDVWRFIGTRQVVAYLAGEPLPLPEEPLQEGGIYGLVRHPLYLFALLIVWPIPLMTVNTLLLNAGVTLYLLVGSLIEERRLLNAYGETYHRYRQRVPWLIPWPFHRYRQEQLRSHQQNVIK